MYFTKEKRLDFIYAKKAINSYDCTRLSLHERKGRNCHGRGSKMTGSGAAEEKLNFNSMEKCMDNEPWRA